MQIKNTYNHITGFFNELSNPTGDASRGVAVILGLMVGAQTLINIFWINVFSNLGGGYAFMVMFPYAYITISYTSLLVFYRLKRTKYFTFTQLAMLLVMPFLMQWVIGGFEASSSISMWGVLSPVGAMLLLGRRQSTPWFLLFSALTMFSWIMNDTFVSFSPNIPLKIKEYSFLINVGGVALILYVVMRYFQAQTENAMVALVSEQGKTDRLLLNILPKAIAERLKQSRDRIADKYDSVTILFADLVGFTTISADMPADDLVEMLSRVFSSFDELAEKHGAEKIKTIGDAYMVVCGAPETRQDHANAIADLALDMIQKLEEIAQSSHLHLMMRIGINSGPVIAGVIGSAKFSYDLWGDTVNLASRMEHYGVPGRIHVSESSYQLLKNQYQFEAREPIDVKGKGVLQSYFLMGRNVPAIKQLDPKAVS